VNTDVERINDMVFIIRAVLPLLCSIGFWYLWAPSRSWGVGLLLLISAVHVPDYGRVATWANMDWAWIGPGTVWSIATATIVALGWLVVLILILRRVFIVTVTLNGKNHPRP
jgi:hypothetical protein